jgi:hypothetical protein
METMPLSTLDGSNASLPWLAVSRASVGPSGPSEPMLAAKSGLPGLSH